MAIFDGDVVTNRAAGVLPLEGDAVFVFRRDHCDVEIYPSGALVSGGRRGCEHDLFIVGTGGIAVGFYVAAGLQSGGLARWSEGERDGVGHDAIAILAVHVDCEDDVCALGNGAALTFGEGDIRRVVVFNHDDDVFALEFELPLGQSVVKQPDLEKLSGRLELRGVYDS